MTISMPNLPVPTTSQQLTAEWLQLALGEAAPSANVTCERIGEGYGLASEVYRCQRPGHKDVIAKLFRIEGIVTDREIQFHRTFGAQVGIRTPRCLYSQKDKETGHAVMLFTPVDNCTQGDLLKGATQKGWTSIASQLAQFHSKWRQSSELVNTWLPELPLQRSDEWFDERREKVLARFGDRLKPHAKDVLDNARTLYRSATTHLQTASQTLLHADLHLDNVLFDNLTEEATILDWARASRGPGVLDVAAVLLGIDEQLHRSNFLSSYMNSSKVPPNPREFGEQLQSASTVVFVTNTMGIANWFPEDPRSTAIRDHALDAAQRLGQTLMN